MKSKIAVLFLIGLLCLTMGCSNTSPITKEPASVSSSESKEVPDQAKSTQATEKTEADRPQSTESQTDNRAAENPASVSESDTQPTEAPDQAETTARKCCNSQANLERKQTSPNADRKPLLQLHRLKQNRPHHRQRKPPNRQNSRSPPSRPRKNPQRRHLTSATGSVLLRAMPRVSVLR